MQPSPPPGCGIPRPPYGPDDQGVTMRGFDSNDIIERPDKGKCSRRFVIRDTVRINGIINCFS
jgi:hypothetical protein